MLRTSLEKTGLEVHETEKSKIKIQDDFYAKYKICAFINEGTYGKVYKCCKIENLMTTYAVKIQSVSFSDDSYTRTMKEAKIWSGLEHENIARLHACFLQDERFHFLMELVPGSNLFDEILRKTTYNETCACLYVKQLLNALTYLHERNVMHRDIKPDNIMLCQHTGKDEDTSNIVKLVDFGLARRLHEGRTRMECAPSGAPLYMAPETIMEIPLGCPVDVWSCGVVMYILLYGSPPFWSTDTNKLFVEIVRSDVDFPRNDEESEPVSFLANDLVQEMLVKNQDERITAREALEHPWIAQSKSLKLSREHRRSTLEHLSKFHRSTSVFEPYKRFNGIESCGSDTDRTHNGQRLEKSI